MNEGKKAPRNTGAKTALARMRLAAGLTQAQLAQAIGSQQKEVTRWERGVVVPRADKLLQIARVLNCSMEDLFMVIEKDGRVWNVIELEKEWKLKLVSRKVVVEYKIDKNLAHDADALRAYVENNSSLFWGEKEK